MTPPPRYRGGGRVGGGSRRHPRPRPRTVLCLGCRPVRLRFPFRFHPLRPWGSDLYFGIAVSFPWAGVGVGTCPPSFLRTREPDLLGLLVISVGSGTRPLTSTVGTSHPPTTVTPPSTPRSRSCSPSVLPVGPSLSWSLTRPPSPGRRLGQGHGIGPGPLGRGPGCPFDKTSVPVVRHPVLRVGVVVLTRCPLARVSVPSQDTPRWTVCVCVCVGGGWVVCMRRRGRDVGVTQVFGGDVNLRSNRPPTARGRDSRVPGSPPVTTGSQGWVTRLRRRGSPTTPWRCVPRRSDPEKGVSDHARGTNPCGREELVVQVAGGSPRDRCPE